MAKQLVNPFERHIEKLVLAIAGLLLIGVMVKFVFSSPNVVQLGQETAMPATVDGRLAQKANEILQRIRDAKLSAIEHDPKFDDFVASIAPLKPEGLPVATAIGPEVPIVDEPGVATGRATLVVIPPAPKPVYTMGRNTLVGANAPGGDTAVDWVMLAIPFDVKGMSELQRRAWGATQSDVIFATPEVQRRMRHSDGSWSDGDWQTIATSPSYKMPNPPTIRLVDEGGKIVANKDDVRAVQKFQEEMADPRTQLAMLRPLPPTFSKDEQAWKFPLITTYENVVKQDQEFLTPNNPTAPVEDRYGIGGTAAGKPKPEPKTASQVITQELDDARAQMETGRNLWSKNEVTLAYNRAIEVTSNKEATPEQKAKAQKLMKDAELLIADIQYNPKGDPTKAGKGPSAQPDAPKKRDKSPQQDIWAYDAGVGSITNGETYQYRMRARVLNRLAGVPESFADPKDAQVVIVAGDWSEPTDPIHIPGDSWYFVTREDKNKREVFVEFFRWYEGVWVKSKAENFVEGEVLEHQERVEVPDKVDPTIAAKPTVPFGEDLTLLDIEFARPLRERKSGSGKDGVKFAAQPTPETAAVFVDSKGRLHERVVVVDKENPQKKELKIWTPSKKAAVP